MSCGWVGGWVWVGGCGRAGVRKGDLQSDVAHCAAVSSKPLNQLIRHNLELVVSVGKEEGGGRESQARSRYEMRGKASEQLCAEIETAMNSLPSF